MASSRFASLEGSIETFIEEQENQNTVKKTKRDVTLLTEFFQTKGETRIEIAEIPPAELNELLSEFILGVPFRSVSLRSIRKLTRSLRSLDRFLILLNS